MSSDTATQTTKTTQELAVGDVIQHPADMGTRLAWHEIIALEEAPHGEWAVQFSDETVMIAELDETWPVAPRDSDDEREWTILSVYSVGVTDRVALEGGDVTDVASIRRVTDDQLEITFGNGDVVTCGGDDVLEVLR